MKTNKKHFLLVGLSAFALLAACASNPSSTSTSTPIPVGLPDIKNLAFDQDKSILSFDKVPGATAYDYEFKHGDEVVYSDTLETNVVDVESLGIAGSISATVIAKNATTSSKPASISFAALTTFDDVKIEAEDHLYNFGTGKKDSNFRNNPLASNGAYVGGTDDAGQGIYINYLSPFAGEFDIDAYYCCDFTDPVRDPAVTQAHHDVLVNGVKQTAFVYTEQTGWGGASFNPAVSSTKVTLVKGWNTISVMKNGVAADNWGDFAELDYLEIHGNGKKYNVDDLAEYGDAPAFYRLEAEMGSPRKRNAGGISECKNPCEAGSSFSNGFIMGNLDKKYDGVEWHFYTAVKAKYSLKLCYAGPDYKSGNAILPSVIVTQEAIGLSKNVDFKDYTRVQPKEAFPFTSDWGVTDVANESLEITLEAGDNYIYCLNFGDTSIFQIDYADLTFIAEVE